jgi:hypothetical protein
MVYSNNIQEDFVNYRTAEAGGFAGRPELLAAAYGVFTDALPARTQAAFKSAWAVWPHR